MQAMNMGFPLNQMMGGLQSKHLVVMEMKL